MPCYTEQITSIELKAKNFALLDKAAAKLRWLVAVSNSACRVYETNLGTVRVENNVASGVTSQINSLRKTYAEVVVDHAKSLAASKGWLTQSTGKDKVRISLAGKGLGK